MDHFLYRDGILQAEGVAIPDIAATVGTPFYVYSAATLTRHYRLFTEALAPLPHLVCFAIKSLSNVAVLKLLGDLGAGMDVVSGGEYLRAKAAGVPGDRIVFSGVGKTREEMRLALTGGIRQFNLESEPEMRALSEVAMSLGVVAPVTVLPERVIDGVTGFVRDEPAAFADAALSLLNDDALWRRQHAAAIAHQKGISWAEAAVRFGEALLN